MANALGRCGINCSMCQAFIATQTDDAALREKTAEQWSRDYHSDIKPEHIVCDGCVSLGRHFQYCSVCEIRSCAESRKLINCGQCSDYACDKLMMFFAMVPAAQENLDAYRNGL